VSLLPPHNLLPNLAQDLTTRRIAGRPVSIRSLLALFTVATILLFGLVWWAKKASPDKDVLVAVITASATFLTSVIVLAVTQADSKAKELREAHRVQKIEVYSEFSELIFMIFASVKVPAREDLEVSAKEALIKKTQEDLQTKYVSLNRKLLLWSSPEVMTAWLEFRAYAQSSSTQTTANPKDGLRTLVYMDEVLRAMRSDLQLSNSGLKKGDLVKSFLTDPETLNSVLDE
jgi:hypothetical protein